MGLDDNKAIARSWFDVMNHHDLSVIDRAYADDYVYRGPDGMEVSGRDQARRIAAMLIEAVPDRVATVVSQVAEGDLVATRWEAEGTNTGPLFGKPPTNGPFRAEGLVISRIEGGVIVEDYEINHITT
jgi:predicted ester cyclase